MCSVEGPPMKTPVPRMMADDQPFPIYLDHNATTPVCDEAWDAMLGCRPTWGNPSSTHPYGLQAKFVVEGARARVAAAIGAAGPDEIVFTSGGTEANNLAIIGAAQAVRAAAPARRVVVSTVFEHPAVEEVLAEMKAALGYEVVLLPVSHATGVVELDALRAVLAARAPEIALVTVMHANNELGSIQPVRAISDLVRAADAAIVIHTDAAQSIGKIAVDVAALGVDLLSICSHKFYGPKGVGALYRRAGVELRWTTFGAKHERGLRPGTENIILDNGMAAALCKAVETQAATEAHVRRCRDALHEAMAGYAAVHGFELQVNGSLATALPNTLNVAVYHAGHGMYISSARLNAALGVKVAMSAGSACHAAPPPGETFPVSAPLRAIGVGLERAIGTLRLSTGHMSTVPEMQRAAQIILRGCVAQMPI
jgi:cysteine sulfinate desulfinase/cysteine desulfurase-like protein